MIKTLMLTGIAGIAIACAGPAAAAAGDCNRACLDSRLGAYLAAVIAKNPAAAPLAFSFRETQNAVTTPAGTGIWQTNTGYGALQRRYLDPVTGNAEFFGLLKEGDADVVASLRIKVDRQKITEAEWHLARKGDAGMAGVPGTVIFDAAKLAAFPPTNRVVPKAQRIPRDDLIAIANSYFDGITANDTRLTKAHPGCTRHENGFEVTGRPLRPEDDDQGFEAKGDCMTGYRTLQIANVAARRYLVIDEEAQVVVASAVFLRQASAPKRRNAFMEIFTIDGGKIRNVHASMSYVDPNRPVPNWAPYDGNFAVAPNLVTGN